MKKSLSVGFVLLTTLALIVSASAQEHNNNTGEFSMNCMISEEEEMAFCMLPLEELEMENNQDEHRELLEQIREFIEQSDEINNSEENSDGDEESNEDENDAEEDETEAPPWME